MSLNVHLYRFDLFSLISYLLLLMISLVMVHSVTHDKVFSPDGLSYAPLFYKHLFSILLALVVGISIYLLRINFLINYSIIAYGIVIVMLVGLFVFGQSIAGSQSWYRLGSIGLQPSELAKLTTVLMVAKIFHNSHRKFKRKNVIWVLGVIALPMFLILLQPDFGTAITFLFLSLLLYGEGLGLVSYLSIFYVGILFMMTLVFGPLRSTLIILLLAYLTYFILRRYNIQWSRTLSILITACSLGIILISSFAYQNVMESHHRNRLEVFLGLKKDNQNIGYHLHQSKMAIADGRLLGTGLFKGPRTLGNFIPEQHNDYIFTAVAEQWGFLGSLLLIGLYTLLVYRVITRASLHRSRFEKIFSYGFACFLLSHFFINIGMNIGLVPTIGIPLPYMSYGGSNLLTFTLFLAIYLSMDYRRLSVKYSSTPPQFI
ncbi:MAG: rod shape-determining protein RodA [Flavobacteriaceae bacterium]|nr:rod shape-determining protein RodA [Flavobacteriaceae bacterium]